MYSRTIGTVATASSALVLAGALLSNVAYGQAVAPMDKQAVQILQAMSDHLGKAKTVSFRARMFFDTVRKSGIKIKSAQMVQVTLKRPSSFRALTISDNGSARTSWYDGTKLTVLHRHINKVMQLDFKGTTDALLDELTTKHDAKIPLVDLLYSDVAKALKEHVISAEYIGIKRVNGIKCHHLSFESTGADWQVWVRADATPVPLRFAISYVNVAEKPELLASIDRWSANGDIADDHFNAIIPKGAKKTAFGKTSASQ